jgi:hypothetical protein
MAAHTTGSGKRLQLGTAVLSAAREIDTRFVKDRLQRFTEAQRSCVNAQRKLDGAQTALSSAKARLDKLDAVQDHALEVLAKAVANDGQPRRSPFTAFGADSPSVIARLQPREEEDAIRRLVATVLRQKGVSKATLAVAEKADQAARAVEQAIAQIATLEHDVVATRQKRDAVGKVWEAAFAALRRGARAAADDGAPDLYPTLFPRLVRAASRTKAPPSPTPAVATEPSTPTTTQSAA